MQVLGYLLHLLVPFTVSLSLHSIGVVNHKPGLKPFSCGTGKSMLPAHPGRAEPSKISSRSTPSCNALVRVAQMSMEVKHLGPISQTLSVLDLQDIHTVQAGSHGASQMLPNIRSTLLRGRDSSRLTDERMAGLQRSNTAASASIHPSALPLGISTPGQTQNNTWRTSWFF
jgi:hypothetical protein